MDSVFDYRMLSSHDFCLLLLNFSESHCGIFCHFGSNCSCASVGWPSIGNQGVIGRSLWQLLDVRSSPHPPTPYEL
jgi:hypothetical protein